MSDAIRIDELIVDPSGKVFVRYTRGVPPLPAERSGNEVEFATKADFAQAMASIDIPDDKMIVLACAPLYKQTPLLTNASAYKGKTFVIDTSGAVNVAVWS